MLAARGQPLGQSYSFVNFTIKNTKRGLCKKNKNKKTWAREVGRQMTSPQCIWVWVNSGWPNCFSSLVIWDKMMMFLYRFKFRFIQDFWSNTGWNVLVSFCPICFGQIMYFLNNNFFIISTLSLNLTVRLRWNFIMSILTYLYMLC